MPASRKPASERFTTRSCFDDDLADAPKKPMSMKHPKNKKKVWFDRVEIYEHAYALGENPSVSDGAPLTIEWEAQDKNVYELEYYETYNPSSKRRRAKNGLKLTVTERAQL